MGILTTKLPKWVFILTIFVAVIFIALITWQAILMLKDIRQVSSGIGELSGDMHKGDIPIDWKTYKNEELILELENRVSRVGELNKELIKIGEQLGITEQTKVEELSKTPEIIEQVKQIEKTMSEIQGILAELKARGLTIELIEENGAFKLLITDEETTDWKTYRNEEYGFEIDYPTVGWEFETYYRGAPTLFSLCKQQGEGRKMEEEFCIFYTINPMYPKCHDLSWKEIMKNAGNCFIDGFGAIQFEEEIITDSGAKGYKGKGRSGTELEIGVFFLIPDKLVGGDLYPVLFLRYHLASFLKPDAIYPYASEKNEILSQMVSTFRFIEE